MKPCPVIWIQLIYKCYLACPDERDLVKLLKFTISGYCVEFPSLPDNGNVIGQTVHNRMIN